MHLLTKKNCISFFKQYMPNPRTIVEAGAFNGADTIRLAHAWPDATIHAFEPVPAIFEQLEQNTRKEKNICRYPLALSDHTGSAEFHISEKPQYPGMPFQAGSLLAPQERLAWSQVRYPHTITVKTITLDDWARTYHIPIIDFLWLDVQGHELAILQASGHILKTVQLLYVEVHFIQAYEHQPRYGTVKTWLEENGFIMIGKDFTNETDWFFGNALFLRKT